MMKSFEILVLVCSIFVFTSCGNKKPSIESTQYDKDYLKTGADISSSAQTELMKHVKAAINEGGTEYAVEFCNIKAVSIIDSLNEKYNCSIARVSERNRNPGNTLKTEMDKEIWDYYKEGKKSNDTVIANEEGNIFYYKPIKLIKPACLKCHGKPGENINQNTLSKIDSLYPDDHAKNYNFGDIRGIWKIEFKVESEK